MTEFNVKIQIKSLVILKNLRRNKLFVDIIVPTTRGKDKPTFNIL